MKQIELRKSTYISILVARVTIALACLTAILLSGCVYTTDPHGNIVAVAPAPPVVYSGPPVYAVPGAYDPGYYGYSSGYYNGWGNGGLYWGNNGNYWGGHRGNYNNWGNRYDNNWRGYGHGNFRAARWNGARGSAVVVRGGAGRGGAAVVRGGGGGRRSFRH